MNETQLSDLQMAIMRVLWDRGEATSAEVHEALYPERGLAPTTVATVVSRLAKKGIIDYRQDGRQHIYHAAVSEGEVRRSMVGELVDRVFGGNPAALVSHLLTESALTPDELARLQALAEATDDPEDRSSTTTQEVRHD